VSLALGSSGDPPPVPIAATYDPDTRDITVTFDVPLMPPVLLASNWRIRYGSREYQMAGPPTVLGPVVSAQRDAMGGGIPCPPGNTIEYLATPPELTGLTGAPVIPFSQPWV
jgi:hypothetical protein